MLFGKTTIYCNKKNNNGVNDSEQRGPHFSGFSGHQLIRILIINGAMLRLTIKKRVSGLPFVNFNLIQQIFCKASRFFIAAKRFFLKYFEEKTHQFYVNWFQAKKTVHKISQILQVLFWFLCDVYQSEWLVIQNV